MTLIRSKTFASRQVTGWKHYVVTAKVNGAFALMISGAVRFRFEDGDALDVEISDYH